MVERGMTPARLADKAALGRATIYNALAGDAVSMTTALAISNAIAATPVLAVPTLIRGVVS